MKDKSSHIVFYMIASIITFILIILYLGSFFNGIKTNGNKGIKYYESLDELVTKTALDIEIPSYVSDNDDLKIQSVMGQLIQIHNDTFVLKVAPFVDNNADPLGLYEKSNVDNKYKVDNGDINYFRYRSGYSVYPNSIIINWCTDSTAYGIMIEQYINEDEALGIVGLSKEDIEKYIELKEQHNIEADYRTEVYELDTMCSLELPKFKTDITVIDGNGIKSIYIDKKLIIVIIYNKADIENNTYGEQSEVIIDENIVIRYLSENPFEIGTLAYNDYNNFVSTIEDIKNSVIYH